MIALFWLAVLPAPAAAQSGGESPQPAGMQAALRQGIERAFNLDFPGAGILFRKAVEIDPEDPTGYAFLAVNQLFKAEMDFDPAGRQEAQEAMLRHAGEALACGDRRVAMNPRDGRAWFAMALARMAKFRWALRHKQVVTTVEEAYSLWSYLEIAQTLEPDNHDIYLLTGLIRYHVDRLPDLVRFFSSLLIAKGDSRQGLADLERAAAKGHLLKELAQSELISTYLNFEKQPARALPLARDLQRRFPRNYNVSFALANVYSELHQFRDALAIARELERGIASGRPPFVPQLKSRHDQLMGRIFFNQGDYARAEGYFRQSVKDTSEANARVRAWSLVRLGMIHDARKERGKAEERYRQTLAIDGAEGIAKVEARKYLQAPYVPPPDRERARVP